MLKAAPRVRKINKENLFDENGLYNFIRGCHGKDYNNLKGYAIKYFNKTSNQDFFKQIITVLNLLGLIERNEQGVVQKNEFLEAIYAQIRKGNDHLAGDYINYFLINWQYPTPSYATRVKNDPIIKPYLMILKILLQLSKVNPKESYLTYTEFYSLFHKLSVFSPSEIDETYINNFIQSRGKLTKPAGDLKRLTNYTYFKGPLEISDLLTFEPDQYPHVNASDFMFGFKDHVYSKVKADFLIREYKDDYYSFNRNISGRDEVVFETTQWARYLNDQEKFTEWRGLYMAINDIADFKVFCNQEKFTFDDDLIRRFILSLNTKPFLILTGISGSGKTKIAELWGLYKKKKLHISVGSNWNDNKKLLGFKNVILSGEDGYQSTELVRFIKDANENPFNDYVVILDEMNLSHVERYFSDFLSALESLDHIIKLPDGSQVKWSSNLKIIGTVNVDETTYMFSPKVLDRANVIEMNGMIPSKYIRSVATLKQVYQEITSKSWYSDYTLMLDELYKVLNGRFAYRVIDEISTYILESTKLYGDQDYKKFLDEQIYQKLLPKLHGSKLSLKPILSNMITLLGTEEQYKLSKSKVEQMQDDVEKGYASFIGE